MLTYYRSIITHGLWLQPVLSDLDIAVNEYYNGDTESVSTAFDMLYNNIVTVLNATANACVPRHKKFYKYWWDKEMNLLNDESIYLYKLWKAAGKPRHSPIFDRRQRCKSIYRKRIREREKCRLTSYTNDLHECLLKKEWSHILEMLELQIRIETSALKLTVA